METYLLSAGFSNKGYGTHSIANRIYNLGLGIKRINLEDYGKKHSIFNILDFYYIKRGYKIFKGNHIWAFEPYLIPKRFLKLPAKKTVAVYDFYVFDKNYTSELKRLKLRKRVFRSIMFRTLRKSYKNIKYFDNVIVFDQRAKDRLVDFFQVPKERIRIMQINVIDDKFKKIDVLKDSNKKVIGYINGFGFNKAEKLELFIKNFKEIDDNSIEFRIYGRGFPFENLIKDDKRIKYFGFLPDEKIVETYNSFDAYLSTSTMEGFGLPIMQAKACKVPVLSYDGELLDIVKRNTCLWDGKNIKDIIKNRLWEKVDIENAYKDVEECRPVNVKENIKQFLDSLEAI